MCGIVFMAGMQLRDLWAIQVDTYFSVLHPIIYIMILTYVIKRPRKKTN